MRGIRRSVPSVVLGCVLLLAGCAFRKKYAVDPALVAHWDEAVYKAEPFGFPYIIRYCDGKKVLSYLASRHGTELTMALVATEFDSLMPEALVVEGYPAVLGFSDESTMWRHRATRQKDVLARMNEMEFAVWLAANGKIPFIGGEPRNSDIVERMLERGYTRDDVRGYFVAREIPSWRGVRKATAEDFDRLLLELNERGLGMSRQAFIRWYEDKAGKPFDFGTFPEYPPIAGPDSTFLNKLAADVDIIRNAGILEVVADCLKRYDRVLVVYGGGHYISQKPALDSMLGKPCGYRQESRR